LQKTKYNKKQIKKASERMFYETKQKNEKASLPAYNSNTSTPNNLMRNNQACFRSI
jgi:hypothetical protein